MDFLFLLRSGFYYVSKDVLAEIFVLRNSTGVLEKVSILWTIGVVLDGSSSCWFALGENTTVSVEYLSSRGDGAGPPHFHPALLM